MSNEEIIELWRKGYSIEQIVNRFPSMICRIDKTGREALYHKVEVIIFNYQKEIMK